MVQEAHLPHREVPAVARASLHAEVTGTYGGIEVATRRSVGDTGYGRRRGGSGKTIALDVPFDGARNIARRGGGRSRVRNRQHVRESPTLSRTISPILLRSVLVQRPRLEGKRIFVTSGRAPT